MFTTIVIANNTTPSPISAERLTPVASPKLFAMIDAVVRPGANTFAVICVVPPITSATAIVSPMARPRPSMTAPIRPDRTRGRTATRSISQRVAPIAIAAFLSVRREFIGRPEKVKALFLANTVELHRERAFQGHGMLDLLKVMQAV